MRCQSLSREEYARLRQRPEQNAKLDKCFSPEVRNSDANIISFIFIFFISDFFFGSWVFMECVPIQSLLALVGLLAAWVRAGERVFLPSLL